MALPLSEIEAARSRLDAYLRPTPLAFCDPLARRCGRVVALKLESLQPTGAFKVRPALNGLLTHLDQARSAGVIASSSGNFAQAVAWAARELGVDAQIVMMSNASAFKRDRTRAYGATVVECAPTFEARWETTFRIERESGRLLVHPYDSEETIAGDGVIGLELIEQYETDFTVAVPISGGGLISGIASAVKALRPGCRVVGVQPTANPSMERSLAAGSLTTTQPGGSVADALAVATPGERTFEIVRELVDDVVLVSEEELIEAVRFLANEGKVVAEAGGAAGVAALLAGKLPPSTGPCVCVVSGGNVAPAQLGQWLARD